MTVTTVRWAATEVDVEGPYRCIWCDCHDIKVGSNRGGGRGGLTGVPGVTVTTLRWAATEVEVEGALQVYLV